MKQESRIISGALSLAVLLLIGAGTHSGAQNQQNPTQPAQSQTQISQTSQIPDLGPLNLSPDQIQKIRLINAELKDQRQAANQRLRLAQRALTEAVESP